MRRCLAISKTAKAAVAELMCMGSSAQSFLLTPAAYVVILLCYNNGTYSDTGMCTAKFVPRLAAGSHVICCARASAELMRPQRPFVLFFNLGCVFTLYVCYLCHSGTCSAKCMPWLAAGAHVICCTSASAEVMRHQRLFVLLFNLG